jgi:phosphatidylethanolamine/phosphatidyl-N-methylethanolamine N-methyltransferase
MSDIFTTGILIEPVNVSAENIYFVSMSSAHATRWNNLRYYFLAPVYDRALKWFYKPLVKQLIEKVNSSEGSAVLEVGVGTGISIPYYNQEKQVTAIDCSLPMLNNARKKIMQYPAAKIDLVHSGAESYADHAQQFDHIIFCNSLSVIADPREVLKNYYERLKNKGHIYILNHFTPERGLLHHIDKLLFPVGKVLGFKSYFPLSGVIDPSRMKHITVSLDGYWSIVTITKQEN